MSIVSNSTYATRFTVIAVAFIVVAGAMLTLSTTQEDRPPVRFVFIALGVMLFIGAAALLGISAHLRRTIAAEADGTASEPVDD